MPTKRKQFHLKKTRKKRKTCKKTPEDKRIEKIIKGAVGPYRQHCAAFGNPSGPKTPNYINICKLSIGKIPINKNTKHWDTITKGILAYDRAETNDAFLGQLNVVAASSFISPHGALWGYDLAKTEPGASIFSIKNVPVFSIEPLLDAGEALFGNNQHSTKYFGQMGNPTIRGLRYYVNPGEIQPCAVKSTNTNRPGVIWSAIGVGIPVDTLANKVARLFYEDAGAYSTKDAVRMAKLGREILGGKNLLKLEVNLLKKILQL